MSEEWLNLVPEPARSHGIWLASQGINETAWPISCARSVTTAVHEAGYAILGGDIYIKNATRFVPAYDNWACDISRGEPWLTYVHRSYEETNQYLLAPWHTSDRWFTLVTTSKPSAEQLAKSYAR